MCKSMSMFKLPENNEYKKAIESLQKHKENYTFIANHPLRELRKQTLTMVMDLLDVFDGIKPCDNHSLSNAAFLEANDKDYPIIKALFNMGAPYTEMNLRWIKACNSKAADFLQEGLNKKNASPKIR